MSALHVIVVMIALCPESASTCYAASKCTTFSGPSIDTNRLIIYDVQSIYQPCATKIRILLPEPLAPEVHYPVIYLLSAEPGTETRYGDGLLEVKKQRLHTLHNAIFVQATFSDVPWYADAVSNQFARQESYFLRDIIPFVERHLPVKTSSTNRLLLGFSKSGCGAFSLLLRHSQVFGKAAAWDAPLAMQQLGSYESALIFETQRNFEKYRITDLINSKAGQLKNDGVRLILAGHGKFGVDMRRIDKQLTQLEIPHQFLDGPVRSHCWSSGWLPETVKFLLAP